MEESIYNIIPKEFQPPPKEPLYRSKYPPNIPPTGSTFGHHTTSKPQVVTLSILECEFIRRISTRIAGAHLIWRHQDIRPS